MTDGFIVKYFRFSRFFKKLEIISRFEGMQERGVFLR